MKCPHCGEILLITERQGIEIDYCPKCRGVWLDKGELDKIIEKTESSESKHYDNDRKEKDYDDNEDFDGHRHFDKNNPARKKRGGFLSNLFDFD
jgi:uncharacterized protein